MFCVFSYLNQMLFVNVAGAVAVAVVVVVVVVEKAFR